MNPTQVIAIARKECYHLLRDFRSLYLAFMVPLLLILLFGYALSLDVEHIPTVVVDFDRTPASRDFIRELDASTTFDVVDHLPDTRHLIRRLDLNQAMVGVVIPPGWAEDLSADRETPRQVIIDGSDPNSAGIARGYVTGLISNHNAGKLSEYLNRQGREELKPPLEGRIRVWFNEDLESRNFIVPGIIAIIIMIVGAMLTSLVIAREYENGTMETIRSLPVGAPEFLAGKAIPYFGIGMIDVLVAILMGQALFGVVMKSSFWLMLLASAVYLGVALSLGLAISILTKSQLVANQLAILLTYLPSLLLSDFVFPIGNLPSVLQKITAVVPARYYIDILNGLYLRSLGLAHLWSSYLVLALMCAALCTLNLVVLKREGL